MTKETNFRKYRWMVFGTLLFLGMIMALSTIRASAGSIEPVPATLTTDTYDMNGDGVMDEVYEISNAAQLYWFAGLVNGTLDETEQNSSANAVLTKNITVNRYVLDNIKNVIEDTSDFVSWTPIGTEATPYQGKFDGLGHTVWGLYYNQKDSDYAGFFGCLGVPQSDTAITSDASISNVHVRHSYFSARQYVGGLCGYNHYGSISKSSFDGKVMGNDDVGGLCGLHTGKLTLSYNRGDVVNSGDHTGGLCGSMERGGRYAITNCYNTGNVLGTSSVGGICGYADDNTGGWYCYSSGTYTGTSSYSVKGLCGAGNGVMNSFYIGEGGHTEDDFANGYVAYQLTLWSGLGVWGQTIGEEATPVLFGETVYMGKDGSDNNVYHNHLEKDLDQDGFCSYCSKQVLEPDQINGVYQISNKEELDWLSWYVNLGNTSVHAVLTADITYNTALLTEDGTGLNEEDGKVFHTWTPIGNGKYKYQGTFDGQNHTIYGLYLDDTISYKGLFGCAGGNAKIKNVNLSNSYFKGNNDVGMICGSSSGTIENCHSSGLVKGTMNVGGICGTNNGGTISKCSNAANISAIDAGRFTGYYVGGIAGTNTGRISHCWNTGSVTAEARYAGGISGYEDNGIITYCYNTGHISAKSEYVGGISGYYCVTISHSFNVGQVDGGWSYVGAIYAYNSNSSSNAQVTNCYYLENTRTKEDPALISKSLSQFSNGDVTYCLNKEDASDTPVWFQNIDNGYEPDAYPSFTGGTVYYDEITGTYSNQVPGTHTFLYSSDGAVITETCTDDCGHTATATLKLDPDKNIIYTGNPIEPATVAYSSNWQGGKLTVSYENNTSISENEAIAKITKDNATATLSFSIQDHVLIYATRKSVITEKCDYCGHKATAALTMDSSDLSYTGNPIEPVKVIYSDGWLGGELPITYENNTKVTEQGAKAKITKENVTATCSFMITKANRTKPVISAIPETVKGKGDGKISGLTTDMEWSLNGTIYKEVTDSDMVFAPGTYFIRYQENENQNRSEPTEVTVADGTTFLSVNMLAIPSAFTLESDKTALIWNDTVVLTLTGPIHDCSCTLKINGEEISPDNSEKEEASRQYTISKVQENLIITLEISDTKAPNVYYLSGSKETTLGFNKYTLADSELILFYKNQQDFLFRIEDTVSNVKSAEFLMSEQNFAEEEDVTGQWTQLLPEENGLYRISCAVGTNGYAYFRVTDGEDNQTICNIPKIVVYEDAVSNTEQISYQLTSGTDLSFAVDLKGNTVKALYLGDILMDPANYTVSENGTITLKKSYLETLAAKTEPYMLRVEYNPQGELYQELAKEVIEGLGIEYTNEAPKPTTLHLTIINPSYSIMAEAGANGSISPSGTTTVEKGTEKTFTFTPNKGYVVDTVTVDGKNVGSVSEYSFSNITGNHTISVTFKAENQTQNTASQISSSQIKKNSVKLDTEATVVWKNNKITVTWGKVSGASGYEIYAVPYGKKMTGKSLVKTVKGQSKTASLTKIGGQKPVSSKVYTIKVKAYKLVDNKKVSIGSSSLYYVVRNSNSKYTNAAKVTVKKKTVTLKKGKTSQIQASITKQSKSKKLLGKPYGASLRYYSTDTSIATVTSKGKIKAKKKGKCYIYVTALNGVHTRVKVTVK